MSLFDTVLLFWIPATLGLLVLLWIGWENLAWDVSPPSPRPAGVGVLALLVSSLAYVLIGVQYWNILINDHWLVLFYKKMLVAAYVLPIAAATALYVVIRPMAHRFIEARGRWQKKVSEEQDS